MKEELTTSTREMGHPPESTALCSNPSVSLEIKSLPVDRREPREGCQGPQAELVSVEWAEVPPFKSNWNFRM
jgi:hypothetical protein